MRDKIKILFLGLVYLEILLLGGCAFNAQEQTVLESSSEQEAELVEDTAYIGEYLDSVLEEPNLEIAKNEDGTYTVQITIYRLTFLSDGVGELTGEGMRFTATDAAGNPIGGVITLEGQTATVTFTDSTWTYLPNGSSYSYTKQSDTPNIWDWPA